MNLGESFRVALRGLLANKLRSALTMLGIIIGIFAVIVLISIGRGLGAFVNQQFNAIGSNLLFVFPITPGSTLRSGMPSSRGSQGLSNEDVAALQDPFRTPDVLGVAPSISGRRLVQYGGKETDTDVQGVTPEYEFVRNFPVMLGSFVTQHDVESEARVAVLGQTTVEELFESYENPIGQTIRIEGIPFRVVGILEEKGGSSFGDEDDTVLVPLTTAQRRLFTRRNREGDYLVDTIFAKAVSEDRLDAAAFQLTEVLRDTHDIQFQDEDDFQVITQDEILSAAGQITNAVTLFLGIIAAISLLVGGIGIMNIMLVSVTERTREIGIRLAIGALEREVLLQFLIEAVVLSSLGGVVGIALATVASITLAGVMNVPYIFGAGINLLSFLFSAAIGVIFGYFPARRAASLNPIDALRHE